GLPTRHGFDVLRIHQQHLELLRKNVPHRLPVHASGLHGQMRHAALLQPIGQLKQIVSECPEALLLFTALPLGLSPQHTCGNTLLYVRPNHNSRDRQLPSRDSFPPRGVGRFEKRKSPTRALRNFWRLQFVVLLSVPAILVSGLNLRQSNSASVATWLYNRYVISSPFSSFVVGPQRT